MKESKQKKKKKNSKRSNRNNNLLIIEKKSNKYIYIYNETNYWPNLEIQDFED